jgi:hypothetical protein
LPFGIDGIESQGRLSTAADTCYNDKLVAGKTYIYIFKIMFTGTEDLDFFVTGQIAILNCKLLTQDEILFNNNC